MCILYAHSLNNLKKINVRFAIHLEFTCGYRFNEFTIFEQILLFRNFKESTISVQGYLPKYT